MNSFSLLAAFVKISIKMAVTGGLSFQRPFLIRFERLRRCLAAFDTVLLLAILSRLFAFCAVFMMLAVCLSMSCGFAVLIACKALC